MTDGLKLFKYDRMEEWLTTEILKDAFSKPGRALQVNLCPHKTQNKILLATQ